VILVQLLQGLLEKDTTCPSVLAPRKISSAPERNFLQTLVDLFERVCRANLQAYDHIVGIRGVVDLNMFVSIEISLVSVVGCVELGSGGGVATRGVQGPVLWDVI